MSPSTIKLAGLLIVAAVARAQPFLYGQGLLPAGNLLSTDGSLGKINNLDASITGIRAALAAKMSFTDLDLVTFGTNVECLEGRFDTYGTLGRDVDASIVNGGPALAGLQQANLSEPVRIAMSEIALSEQGHLLWTRDAGSTVPCPFTNYTQAFEDWYAAVYQLPEGTTVADRFGSSFNPYQNDETFLLSVLSLEELGATANKGAAALSSNPVITDGFVGLAASATAFAAVERSLLYERRNNTVAPFGETAQQVFARISALRDSLDGPVSDDQGLVNTDPRYIAVPDGFVNNIPTDIHGVTFSRTPQQLIRIYTLASPTAKGGFFPNGLNGNITQFTGYDQLASGTDPIPSGVRLTFQTTVGQIGGVPQPIEGATPSSVPGQNQITQAFVSPPDNGTAATRGLSYNAPTSIGGSSTPMPASMAVAAAGK